MRYMVLALFAALAVACSGTPTSPIDPGSTGVIGLDMSPGQTSTGQKINVYFYPNDVFSKGNVHIVGLPVTVSAFPTTPYFTDKQGSITFMLPQSETFVIVKTASYQGYCPTETRLSLPLYQRTAFILVPAC